MKLIYLALVVLLLSFADAKRSLLRRAAGPNGKACTQPSDCESGICVTPTGYVNGNMHGFCGCKTASTLQFYCKRDAPIVENGVTTYGPRIVEYCPVHPGGPVGWITTTFTCDESCSSNSKAKPPQLPENSFTCDNACLTKDQCCTLTGTNIPWACLDNTKYCCGADCVAFGTTANCLSCGDKCKDIQTCETGGCKCPAATPQMCSDKCVAFGTVENCLSCGDKCKDIQTCETGGCKCPSAKPELCSDVCVAFGTVDNCASCGDKCTAAPDNGAPACNSDKKCDFVCNAPYVRCGTKCISACDADTQECDAENSVCKCKAGLGDCDGDPKSCETDLTKTPQNCGACGHDCTTLDGGISPLCSESTCKCVIGAVRCADGALRECGTDAKWPTTDVCQGTLSLFAPPS